MATSSFVGEILALDLKKIRLMHILTKFHLFCFFLLFLLHSVIYNFVNIPSKRMAKNFVEKSFAARLNQLVQ